MKLLFSNYTVHTAYIAVVDYDEDSKYMSEPTVFELPAGHRCTYDSTPTHFIDVRMNNRYVNRVNWTDKSTRKDFYNNEGLEYPSSHYGFDVETYLLEHPEIGPAQIIDTDMAKKVKKHALKYLSGWYATCEDTPVKGALD